MQSRAGPFTSAAVVAGVQPGAPLPGQVPTVTPPQTAPLDQATNIPPSFDPVQSCKYSPQLSNSPYRYEKSRPNPNHYLPLYVSKGHNKIFVPDLWDLAPTTVKPGVLQDMLKLYPDLNIARPKHPGQLLCHIDGSPLTYYQSNNVLKGAWAFLNIDTSVFKSHSYRIGAATYMYLQGIPENIIKTKGHRNTLIPLEGKNKTFDSSMSYGLAAVV
uniref:Uncharacterized protein n=1 Tax=Magallana gigas TaxID=29159 RepID=A0A8W8IUS9_MAGGI